MRNTSPLGFAHLLAVGVARPIPAGLTEVGHEEAPKGTKMEAMDGTLCMDIGRDFGVASGLSGWATGQQRKVGLGAEVSW